MKLQRWAGVAAVLWMSGASAQMVDGMQLKMAQREDLDLSVGALAISEPVYVGASRRHAFAFPLLDAQWKNGWFLSTVSGAGFRVDASPSLQYGARVTVDFGRSGNDPGGHITTRPEAGVFVNWQVVSGLNLDSSLRYGAGNARRGLFGDIEAEYTLLTTARHQLMAGYGLTFANADILTEYYGRPGVPVGASLRDDKVKLRHRYQFGAGWSSYLEVRAVRLRGQARQSPLARTAVEGSAIGGFSYAF